MFDKNKPVLGIDIGNVITGDTDKAVLFSEKYLEVSQVQGAFAGIRLLNQRFKGQVCLVSKCGGKVQVKTRHWLAHHHFYDLTEVHPNHVFFCEERKGKAVICESLSVTHFIDDRLEVLGYLRTVPNKFLFHSNETEVKKYTRYLSEVTRVNTWEEIVSVVVA
jgi:hypothetical protein